MNCEKIAADAVLGLPGGKSIQDIMNDSSVMSNLSQKLATAINEGMIPSVSLPPNVVRRVKALKNIQKSTTQLEAQFYKEVQHLEAKYHKLYQPLYNKRHSIVTGTYEPTDDECRWVEDGNEPEQSQEEKDNKDSPDKDTKGIPEFWLTAFRNCDIFADVIKDCDEELLGHLTDVKVVYSNDDGLDFTIEFHFSDNKWFTNKVLTMTYYVSCEVNDEDPWSFEGATIHSCQGCHIDWKKGKDLTVKTVKKKTKSKGKGQSKTIDKQVPNETFFNMFSFTKSNKNSSESEEDDAVTQALSDNYNRAEFIRDRLIPRAVLFFTGEAMEEDEEDDFNDDFDEEEDEVEGEDYNPQQDVNDAKPPECKQQ